MIPEGPVLQVAHPHRRCLGAVFAAAVQHTITLKPKEAERMIALFKRMLPDDTSRAGLTTPCRNLVTDSLLDGHPHRRNGWSDIALTGDRTR